jgi:iron complex outermembrane recepter protein
MNISRTRYLLALLAAGSTAIPLHSAMAAAAVSETVESYSIPAGDLKAALQAFARQSSRDLLFDSTLVAGKRTRGYSGRSTAHAALNRVLENSGLTVRIASTGALVVVTASLAAQDAARLAPPPAQAMPQAAGVADAPAVPEPAQEIVVTGTRVLRDGYQAATPVSVITAEQLQTNAGTNLFDYVNTLPALAGSTTPRTTTGTTTSGQGAVNAANLRGLGLERTLTLLDGRRTVGSLMTGVVDVNELPQQLIERVDIQAGGGSATYGSDALSGVVNYILDKDFTGLKAELAGGMTTYGDGEQWKVAVSGGTPFAGGRGHLLLSGEASGNKGIFDLTNRGWADEGWSLMTNPAYTPGCACPQNIVRDRVGGASSAMGGLITAGPLAGTAFGPGGTPYQITYGSLVSRPLMQGGDWRDTNSAAMGGNPLEPKQSNQNLYGRVSFDVGSSTNIWAEAAWAGMDSESRSTYIFYPGAGALRIRTDNAFVPEQLRGTLQAAGTTVAMGSMNQDLGLQMPLYERNVLRTAAGGEGQFDAFGSAWNWNGYVSRGRTKQTVISGNTVDTTRFNNAIDAVYDADGDIVCRSNLTGGNPSCVPYNVFGTGVNSQAAIDYVHASPRAVSYLRQWVVSGTISGEPFSTWAGPVSVALNAEYRNERTWSTSDISADRPSTFFFGVPSEFDGEFSVKEAALEVVVPLAADLPWAENLDVDGAVRATDYSTFGYVTTWKLGFNYSPIRDIRFRGRLSRDTREPTLVDLYQTATRSASTVADPFNGNIITAYTNISQGNPDLQPEVANTAGIGVVFQPGFLPGFSASFDYFDIHIKDAISSGLTPAQTLATCYEGNQGVCALITRSAEPGTPPISFTSFPINLATVDARGFDIEASYSTSLDTLIASAPGTIAVRAFATHNIENLLESGIAGQLPQERAGNNTAGNTPSWRTLASLTYTIEDSSFTVTGRGISEGVYNSNWIECTTGCPVSTPNVQTIDNNTIPGAFYLDLAGKYGMRLSNGSEAEFFLNVRNLFNRNVIYKYVASTNGYIPPAAAAHYDTVGRTFLAGVRIRM